MYELNLAHAQLERMRGMTRFYHQRFFSDTRLIALITVGLLVVGFWAVPEAFLLIPVVTLIGANQTAFDASYLYMARHYAAELEMEINSAMKRQILVGAELEERYLFPLGRAKLVGVRFGADFTWFGWVTLFYTALGVVGFAFGLALGWTTLEEAGTTWLIAYLVALGVLALGSLVVGWWWFVAGAGEARLQEVLSTRFGVRPTSRNVQPFRR